MFYTSKEIVILSTINSGIYRISLKFYNRIIFRIIGKVGLRGTKDKVQQYIPMLSFQ